MFGFRSDRRAERSGGPGDNIRAGVLSLDSVLEARVQQLCQPLLQGLEEGLKSRTWQLERSVATSIGPEWNEQTMNFRDQLLNQQLLKDANNQLHNVLLLHNQTEYVGDPLDLAPGVLATIVFLSVKPGQGAQFAVTDQSPSPTLAFVKSHCHSVYCAVIQAGCSYKLQADGDCMAVFYHLKRDTMAAWQQAAATSQLWYSRQLSKYVLKDHNNFGSERWIYIFDQKYQQTGVSIQHLSEQQQSVADSLHSAAQTGLLDVVLVRITETQKYVISSASDPQERLLEQATKIDGWQTLGGTAVPWASTGFNPNHDLMLQASNYLDRLTLDCETHSTRVASKLKPVVASIVTRTKEKAAYMMWPCFNRWAIFCQREGIDAALSMLQAMVQDLQVPSCTNCHPEAAVGHQCCLPKYTPFANSRHEILRLLQVVSTSKSGEWEGVARSRTFEQLRYAFALPLEKMEKDIARVHITRKLKNVAFTLEATHELIRAAKLLGWLQVTPVLQRMASNFTAEIVETPCCTAPHANGPPAKFKAVAEACEAVLLLLGQRHPVIQVVLYNFVFSLSSAFVQYCLQECPYREAPFPLPKPQLGFRMRAEGCQVCKAFPGSHVVILFACIFERLRDDVGTGPGNAVALSEGIEQSHSKLINMYQSRPHRFQVVHVTPPVHYNTRSSVSLAGSPDMIKLLATCAYMTDQYAVCFISKRECKNCQALEQVFNPLQKTAWHLDQDCVNANIFQQVVVELFSGMQLPHRTAAGMQQDLSLDEMRNECENSLQGRLWLQADSRATLSLLGLCLILILWVLIS
ncbi:TPA: hypothetical protein ACH3X1_000306 [Trebouxia sp. C0004]